MTRKPIIFGNWKMNKTPSEAKEFFEGIKGYVTGDEAAECKACMAARMKSIGYEVVTDRGDYKA